VNISGRIRATVFALALCTRLLFFAAHGPIFSADSDDYLILGRNLAADHMLSEHLPERSVRRGPLYPVILALVRNSPAVAVIVQCILDSVTALMVFELASAVSPVAFAILVSALYAFYPLAVEYSSRILTEIVFVFLVTLALLLVSKSKFSASGAVLALACLGRPFGVIFLIPWCIVLWFSGKPNRVRSLSLLVTCFVLFLTPWLMRTWSVAHRFVFVQVGSAQMLYVPTLVNEDQADQAIWAKLYASDPLLHQFFVAETAQEMAADERPITRQAIANIQANPAAFLKSRIHAVPHLFLSSFDSATGLNAPFSTAIHRQEWLTVFAKVLILAVFGIVPLCAAILGGVRTPFATSVWLTTAVVQLPMYIEPRFWLPAFPAVLVSAAAGMALINEFLCSKSRYPVTQA